MYVKFSEDTVSIRGLFLNFAQKIRRIKQLIVIVGPTAGGKTALSIKLAKSLNCAILSADSRQFYKELSIGTAKPSLVEMDGVPHYFINNLSITKEYTAGKFETEALLQLDKLFEINDYAILVGGSGLYIDAVCKGIDDLPRSPATREQLIHEFEQFGLQPLQDELKMVDPAYYETCDYQNPHRVMRALEIYRSSGQLMSELLSKSAKSRPFSIHYFGLHHPREVLYERINNRVIDMIDSGLVQEVESLVSYRNHQALNTVGYKEIFAHLDGILSLDEAIQQIQQNTRRYAKRQLTWFRREATTTWINYKSPEENAQEILEYIYNTK